jgi:hypothetical protein
MALRRIGAVKILIRNNKLRCQDLEGLSGSLVSLAHIEVHLSAVEGDLVRYLDGILTSKQPWREEVVELHMARICDLDTVNNVRRLWRIGIDSGGQSLQDQTPWRFLCHHG